MYTVMLTNKLGKPLRLIIGQEDPHSRWFAWEWPNGTDPRKATVGRGYLNTTTLHAMWRELAACTWDGKFTVDGKEFSLPVQNHHRTVNRRCTESRRYETQMGHSRGAWWGSPGPIA
jgi:hypothetical protein